MNDNLSTIQPFVCVDPSQIATRWRRWRRSFDYYIKACRTADPPQKALLLHTAGINIQDVFETLTLPEAGEQDDEYSLALNNYFLLQTNRPYERHCFRQLHKGDKENVDQFGTRLRQQADLCNFAEQKDDHITDQLIDKCKSDILRRQLLEKRDVTLANALEIAREATEKQAAKMVTDKVSQAEVNTVHGKMKP